MKPKNTLPFFLLFSAIILTGYQSLRIDARSYEQKFERHISIVNNDIEYPYSYRLLNPYVTHVWYSASRIILPDKAAFLSAYALQNFIVYFFLLWAFTKFSRLWLNEIGAIVSLLVMSLIIPLTLTGYDNLGDLTTAGMMGLGFYFINAGKMNALFPLMFVGAFNELQMILLAGFYFIGKKTNLVNRKAWLNALLLILTFALAYYIINLLRGGSPLLDNLVWLYIKDTKEMTDLQFNLTHPGFIPLWLLLIVPLLICALKDLKNKPEFLKRSLFIMLPLFYVIAFLFIARMREMDKALTIFIILIPMAVISLFMTERNTKVSGGS
jgi:hypothetical protein